MMKVEEKKKWWMNRLCPVISFRVTSEWKYCSSKCAWFNDGECAVLTIAKELKSLKGW